MWADQENYSEIKNMKEKTLEKKENWCGGLPTIKDLYKAGAHFGHLRSRSDARSNDYVFTYRNRVAIIDLKQTINQLAEALRYVAEKSRNGAQFLFIGTKMQAFDLVKETAEELGQSFIGERWPGGLLTNFEIVEKSIKKMVKTEKDLAENKLDYLKKKERVKIEKDLAKTRRIFGGLRDITRKPDVLIAVDAHREEIAIAEAKKAGVRVIAVCDTNSNPKIIDYPILANDDSRSTIKMILNLFAQTIKENYKAKDTGSADVEERAQKALSEKPEEKAEKPAQVKKTAKTKTTKTPKEKKEDGKN